MEVRKIVQVVVLWVMFDLCLLVMLGLAGMPEDSKYFADLVALFVALYVREKIAGV